MAIEEQLNRPTGSTPVVAIIGGTGQTGRWVLKGALQRGYVVRALTRSSSKFAANENLTIIKGDVNNLASLTELVKDVDVVISCFGTVKKPHYIVENGIQTVIAAIHAQATQPRLVHISAIGLGDSKATCKKSFVWSMVVNWVFPLVGKELFADMERGEQLIMKSKDLNFVIARAAVLSNKKAQAYRAQKAQEPVGKMVISRQDVANFMLDTVANHTYDGQAISVFSM